MRFISALLFSAMCLLSCSPYKLAFKPDARIETLHVFLEFHSVVPSEFQDELSKQLDDFIISYNSGNHRFALMRDDELYDDKTLRIRVHASRLVDAKQNAAGVAVSVIGLSAPILMAAAGSDFVIAFWYFPKTISALEWQLSPDIDGSQISPQMHQFASPGFLKSPAKQVAKHGYYFNRLLGTRMKQLEKSLK